MFFNRYLVWIDYINFETCLTTFYVSKFIPLIFRLSVSQERIILKPGVVIGSNNQPSIGIFKINTDPPFLTPTPGWGDNADNWLGGDNAVTWLGATTLIVDAGLESVGIGIFFVIGFLNRCLAWMNNIYLYSSATFSKI